MYEFQELFYKWLSFCLKWHIVKIDWMSMIIITLSIQYIYLWYTSFIFPYTSSSIQGGVMQIVIDWTCNLDYSVDNCVPEYHFRRLDDADALVSPGFNFRLEVACLMNYTECCFFLTCQNWSSMKSVQIKISRSSLLYIVVWSLRFCYIYFV